MCGCLTTSDGRIVPPKSGLARDRPLCEKDIAETQHKLSILPAPRAYGVKYTYLACSVKPELARGHSERGLPKERLPVLLCGGYENQIERRVTA